MKTAVRVLGVIFLIALLAGGGFWLYRSRTAAQTSTSSASSFTQIVQAQRGDLSASITVVGELDPVQSADLAFERMKGTTRLVTLDVAPGNTVTAGQVLATIDPAPYQQALDQATSDLQAAEKKLADLKTPVTDLQRAQADLKIAQAQYQLEQANDTLDDLLHPDMAALRARVVDAQAALAKAQVDLVATQTSQSAADQLSKLRDREAKAAEEHARLAAETYSDSYYQDRLQVAYNKMMDAQDARITAEIQAQMSLLRAQMQVRKTQRTLADAQDAVKTAESGGDELALARAQLAVHDAEVSLAGANDDRARLDEGTDATTLAAAQADLDKKRLAVADAEAALAATRLTAPFDGTILNTNAQAGDTIAANTRILTLADLSQLQVLATIDETTIRRISTGQPATISFDAFPGQSFAGQVLSVPLQGSLQGGVMVYEVPLSLSGADQLPLLVGMTANVAIQVGQAQNALLVPTMALQKIGGLYQVLVPNATDPDGQPEAAPVEVGLSDGTYTQILRGLNPGDQVVVQMQASQSTFGVRGFGEFRQEFRQGGGAGPSVQVQPGPPPGQ